MSASGVIPKLDPQLRRISSSEGERVELSGPWILRALEDRLADFTAQLTEHARDERRHWDLSGVTRLDHAGAMLLWRAWGGRRIPHLTVRADQEAIFSDLEAARPKAPAERRQWLGPFAGIGVRVIAFVEHSLQFIQLVGHLVIDAA